MRRGNATDRCGRVYGSGMNEPGPPGAELIGRHENRKAIASLVLGCVGLASVTALVLVISVDLGESLFDRIGAAWLLLPFIGLTGGTIGCFLGSIAWIDVRRGITDRHLFVAQLGTITGGVAAALVLLALAVLFVYAVIIAVGFSNAGWD